MIRAARGMLLPDTPMGTLTIPPLVMVPDRILDEATKLRNDPDEFCAPRRVGLHQRRLLLREPPFLSKKWGKFLVNLSDIVQQCRSFDLFYLAWQEPHLDSYGPRQLAHSDGVPRGIRVSGFYGFHHQLEELLATILELMVQAVHMTNSHDR